MLYTGRRYLPLPSNFICPWSSSVALVSVPSLQLHPLKDYVRVSVASSFSFSFITKWEIQETSFADRVKTADRVPKSISSIIIHCCWHFNQLCIKRKAQLLTHCMFSFWYLLILCCIGVYNKHWGATVLYEMLKWSTLSWFVGSVLRRALLAAGVKSEHIIGDTHQMIHSQGRYADLISCFSNKFLFVYYNFGGWVHPCHTVLSTKFMVNSAQLHSMATLLNKHKYLINHTTAD